MRRTLKRQLKKCFQVTLSDDEDIKIPVLEEWLERGELDPELKILLFGIKKFMNEVGDTYDNMERDLILRTQSLEYSSSELTNLNDKLASKVKELTQVVDSVRDLTIELRGNEAIWDSEIPTQQNVQEFMRWLKSLVRGKDELQASLIEQLQLTNVLVEAIPIPVFFKEKNGFFSKANRAFCDMFKVKESQILDKSFIPGVECDWELSKKMEHEIIESKEPRQYESEKIIHGKVYNIRTSEAPLASQDGVLRGFVGVYVDLSEQKQGQRLLEKARDEAEKASKLKSEFLANMSHEIRTPMNGIIGMTELVLESELSDSQRDALSIVKSSADSLLQIINDILDFSKIEAGKMILEDVWFDAEKIAAETMKAMMIKAVEKKISLNLNSSVDHIQFKGDPGRVRQIVTNLVSNAVKFTDRGGVNIKLKDEKRKGINYLIIEVEDTGIGISNEKIREIFEAFVQEDSSITRRYGGTGLGLSITKRLVDMMEGKIHVESEMGVGTRFIIDIPLEKKNEPKKWNRKEKEIMVIHDLQNEDCIIVKQIQDIFDKCESEVKLDCALARIRSGEFNVNKTVIVVDLVTPKADHFEFSRQMKLMGIPVLLMTSVGLKLDISRYKEFGIDNYLLKPATKQELHEAIIRLSFKSNSLEIKVKPQEETRKTGHVLVAEDNIINQKLIYSLLNKWGYSCDLVENGKEAIIKLKDNDYDLILMDVQMPVMGGFEATKVIRMLQESNKIKPIKIIALTANAMAGDKEECFNAGMDDYLSKPISAQLLKKILENYIHHENKDVCVTEEETKENQGIQKSTYMEKLKQVDNEIMEIMRPVILEQFDEDLRSLHEKINCQDYEGIKQTAHAIKGILKTLNCFGVAEMAFTIEKNSNADKESLLHMMTKIQHEWLLIKENLLNWNENEP